MGQKDNQNKRSKKKGKKEKSVIKMEPGQKNIVIPNVSHKSGCGAASYYNSGSCAADVDTGVDTGADGDCEENSELCDDDSAPADDKNYEIVDGAVVDVSPSIKSGSIHTCFNNKINYLMSAVKRTILSAKKYKSMDIIGVKEYNSCVSKLESNYIRLSDMQFPIQNKQMYDSEQCISNLQEINGELSTIFRLYGTEKTSDILNICFGSKYISENFTSDHVNKRFEILNKYVHPICYKVMNWKDGVRNSAGVKKYGLHKNRIIEDFMILDSGENLDCFDLARTNKDFTTKVFGIKYCVHSPEDKKTLLISGIVDDMVVSCMNYEFITTKIMQLNDACPSSKEFTEEMFPRFVASLSLKELLVYDNTKLFDRYLGYRTQALLLKQQPIADVTKNFIGAELYTQRATLIQLLLMGNCHEYQYLAYLLYDLLSNDNDGRIDTVEQTMLFDSLPFTIKQYFYDAMRQTKSYTNALSNYDTSKIPLEQRICLLKVNDGVKEKAMTKLKEVRAKSEDSGVKARQYLEGLLKIPFGVYRKEPILHEMTDIRSVFMDITSKIQTSTYKITEFSMKNNFTNFEIAQCIHLLNTKYIVSITNDIVNKIKTQIGTFKRKHLVENIIYTNSIIKKYDLNHGKLIHSGKKREYMSENIYSFITFLFNMMQTGIHSIENCTLMNAVLDAVTDVATKYDCFTANTNPYMLIRDLNKQVNASQNKIQTFMTHTKSTLDDAVHGHEKAKRQIERIMGQWISGENTGYCFGFEGPPGVGKTSLAKHGIAKCLENHDGSTRPFSFIAIGGSSNGSTIDGHNYTYVGSTWGKIVDILMDTKCMNPIIFIDELDKISKTEHGREIIGILTHLIDSTQNDSFQDKYFSGIDLDLSKVLFIFSYNDVNAIDNVLLDRIHRVKFEHLPTKNKLVVAKKHLLPEINKNMGTEHVIHFEDEVLQHIINTYTREPGVRKLKELLFEIVGEINLCRLSNHNMEEMPITITKEDIDVIYLKDRKHIKPTLVHKENLAGLITGLWANSMGQGGVLPIEVSLYPCSSFLNLKLTGMQGDVMKESMNVAKTLAWSMLTAAEMDKLQKKMTRTKYQGLHIHVPEGGTPKDGPSAGTAITTAIYSAFTGKKIRSDIAITGEICLQKKITAIGGLDLKIEGGIRAGVKHFIFPKENIEDYEDFIKKYTGNIEGITFSPMGHIEDVFKVVFE
mgnify:FL=1